MAQDGTADQHARRRRVFYRWLLAYPAATAALLLYYLCSDSAQADVGEFLLLAVIAAGAALALPVLALIDGARCRAIGPAIGGCLLGIAPAALLWGATDAAVRGYEDRRLEQQRRQLAEMAEASARGDRDAVRAAMARLPAQDYAPGRALCIIGGRPDGDGGSDNGLAPAPVHGQPRVPTARLFDAAQALMQGQPRAQREGVLIALLARIGERKELAYLPAWLRLWRSAVADGAGDGATAAAGVRATRILAYDQAGIGHRAGDCNTLAGHGDPMALIAGTWQEHGLRAWVRAGYGFTPDQAAAALEGVHDPAVLDELARAGFDLGATVRGSGDDGPHPLSRLAARLPQELDRSATPAALADLLDAYLRAGADIGRAAYGRTACEYFLSAERSHEVARIEPATPARQAAAQRIAAALCPQGRPPPPAAPARGDAAAAHAGDADPADAGSVSQAPPPTP